MESVCGEKGGTVIYRFELRGRYPGMNEYTAANRSKWHMGAQMKAAAQEDIMWQLKAQKKGIHIENPVFIYFDWIEMNSRRDPDNISGYGRKIILDAMVDVGILIDDSQKYIKGFIETFHKDRENPRILIIMIEVDDENQILHGNK